MGQTGGGRPVGQTVPSALDCDQQDIGHFVTRLESVRLLLEAPVYYREHWTGEVRTEEDMIGEHTMGEIIPNKIEEGIEHDKGAWVYLGAYWFRPQNKCNSVTEPIKCRKIRPISMDDRHPQKLTSPNFSFGNFPARGDTNEERT